MPFLIMLCVNLVVLITWQVVSPLHWERNAEVTNFWGQTTSSVGSCRSDQTSSFAIALYVVDGISLVVACVEAYRARNVSTEYSESLYIGIAMANILGLWIGFGAILFLGKTEAKTFPLIATMAIFIICMEIILFV